MMHLRRTDSRLTTASRAIYLAAALLCTLPHTVRAQDAGPSSPTAAAAERFLYLHNATTQAEANEILTALRNMLTSNARVILVPAKNAIVFRCSDDDFKDAEKLVKELDVPRKLYQLTYTWNDSDGGKRVGSQHYSVVIASGQRNQLKQGSRVPITTSYMPSTPAGQTQVTYIDIGMNLDATIDELSNGLQLRSKVERSSIAEEKAVSGANDPIIRQNTIEGTSILTLGKPVVLGSFDVPGSTRHVEIEVTAELAK